MSVLSRHLLVCLLFASIAANTIQAATDAVACDVPSLTLGIVVPPSEPNATSLQRGAELAVAEVNATGAARVRLEVRNQGGQWGTAGNEAVALACNLHADGIITSSDGADSHLILQVSGRTRVPVVTVCADSSVTEAGVPWVVRVVPRTDRQAAALLAAARPPDRSPAHWWAVVPAGRAGRPIRHDLETAARTTPAAIDRCLEDAATPQELAALAHAIVAAAPQGVLVWLAPARAGVLASTLRAAGYRGHLGGPGSLDCSAFVAAAANAASGFLVAEFASGASPEPAEQFRKEFRRRYEADPDSSATAGFDAARVLIQTLQHVAPGMGYRQFPIVSPATGASGEAHFDASGNRTDTLQVLTCRQGRFVPLSSPEM